MTTGERIKQRRLELKMTVDELAKKLNKNRATIYRYESDEIENLPTSILVPLAKALETTPSYLMGWEPISDEEIGNVFYENMKLQMPMPKTHGVSIKVLGRVAAGIPIDAIEEIIDTEEITEELAKTGHFFGLKIKGDSMAPIICDGDIVIVRQQNDAENGDTVIATINGDEATCKRLRKYKDGIELISNNPSYKPFEFSNEEIEKKPVKIIGKVVELRRKF